MLFRSVCAFVYTRPRFGLWVTVGVLCGAVGDFSLANADRSWFMAGLTAFLVGHVAYSVAFAKDLRPNRKRLMVILSVALGMAALTLAVTIRLAHAREAALIAPVVVYVSTMCTMMALAVLHQSSTSWIAAGAVVFIISDAHIAVNHMLLESSRLSLALSGYATYYAAQYLLVAGAAKESLAGSASLKAE